MSTSALPIIESNPAMTPENLSELECYIPDIVKNAMLVAWRDICADTNCHPLDIEHRKRRYLTFEPRHWAQMAGDIVAFQIKSFLIGQQSFARQAASSAHLRIKKVSNAAMSDLKDGDIYRWSYCEEGDDRPYGRYHCCSRIAVVRNGRLHDTYWPCGSDGKSFGADDLLKLDLVYIGNFDTLEKSHEWQADYYDDADIVDLNHANSSRGNFYLPTSVSLNSNGK